MSSNRLRRALATAFAATLALGGVVMATTTPAAAAPATGTSPSSAISGATLVWGLNGYAQDGIFGPWTFKDFAGNATYLEGNVVGTAAPTNANPQTEYNVSPVPATSFPVSKTGRQANAVKFSAGTGTKIGDVTTISWTGSYTVNAYPAIYNAPNEIYANPTLTINADGSGVLKMSFKIGAGTSMTGTPFEEKDFGRVSLATFDAGSITSTGTNTFRIDPDFNGVNSGISNQTTSCTTGTGWAGSWPTEFVQALNSHESGQSVVAHFYSTGCGGRNDNKPALPIDVTYAPVAPSVTVSEVVIDPTDGAADVTVTGTGFLPQLSTSTRPPVAVGQSGGYYIAFGKFATAWQPSAGNASSTRSVAAGNAAVTKWANPVSNGYVAPNNQNTVLGTDGSFSTTVSVNKATIDAIASAAGNTQYGIAVYPASGGSTPVGEVLVPITFDSTDPVVTLDGPATVVEGTSADFTVEVDDQSATTVEYRFTNGEWVTVEDGAFSLTGLEPGSYDLEVRATDEVGRTGTDSATLEVTEAPVEPIAFTDTVGNTFSNEIAWLSTQGITTGYDNGNGTFSFRPSDAVLREQMAAFLYRFENDGANPPSDAPNATFTDSVGNTFSKHIAWLAQRGITTGYADNTFRPSAPVLREQMAAFLYRLAGNPVVVLPETSPFADIPTTHTFYKQIVWLASTNITTGYVEPNGSKTFKGSQPVLREQMAAFLFRYNNLPQS
ncbi:S-layer homology domain-containing protein [Aeromicrobium alkaliterrae]|uniref:SLH domain-containing protein n=1 Tax=Aeromicrobium alkaliterrae TaxID=302168 RepID=A0ABN2KCP2_9ACTN